MPATLAVSLAMQLGQQIQWMVHSSTSARLSSVGSMMSEKSKLGKFADQEGKIENLRKAIKEAESLKEKMESAGKEMNHNDQVPAK